MFINREELRERLLEELEAQGFVIGEERMALQVDHKTARREAHRNACSHLVERSRKSLARFEQDLLLSIADGAEIEPHAILPRLIEVQRGSREELLFRYARLHWSIPVSAGYGRRLRFLIWDEAHDRLMGILGLCDPVFALGARDVWVGWDKAQRRERLANVMDAFVLGAVPPYAQLLGGKLAALAVSSDEVRAAFARRYAEKQTLISSRCVGPLALITTTSALGRSSIYNRIHFAGMKVFHSVGFTSGSGDFPFINGVYRDLRRLVEQESVPTAKNALWGKGYRNRREVLLKTFGLLGLSPKLMYHGIAREVFVVPLASNTMPFLGGTTDVLETFERPFAELALWWQKRWAVPRARRDESYRRFERQSWRLWEKQP
jgi:hypothetical protein